VYCICVSLMRTMILRQFDQQLAALRGRPPKTFGSAEDVAKDLGGPDYPGIVISDIKMPGMAGSVFLKKLMGHRMRVAREL